MGRLFMQDKTAVRAARIWLEKAKDDLLWAQHSLKGEFFTQVCFIAQQAVEKALKAYLRFCGENIVGKIKTHDLIVLGKACEKFDSAFREIAHELRILNQYYAPTRYPEILGLAQYTKKIAQEASSIASHIVSLIEKKIG